MALSRWVMAMVEAGTKKFEVEVEPDKTNVELREELADVRGELRRNRSRVEELENRLYEGILSTMEAHIEAEGPATKQELINVCIEEMPERADGVLRLAEGSQLRRVGDKYELIEESDV